MTFEIYWGKNSGVRRTISFSFENENRARGRAGPLHSTSALTRGTLKSGIRITVAEKG